MIMGLGKQVAVVLKRPNNRLRVVEFYSDGAGSLGGRKTSR